MGFFWCAVYNAATVVGFWRFSVFDVINVLDVSLYRELEGDYPFCVSIRAAILLVDVLILVPFCNQQVENGSIKTRSRMFILYQLRIRNISETHQHALLKGFDFKIILFLINK